MKKYLIILIIFLLSCSNVFGVDYLYDDFTSKDVNKWDFHSNGGNIEIINDNIFLSSNSSSFPYFLSKNASIFPTENNFTFDIRFRYDSYGHMGDGISVGFTGANGSFFEQFQLWNGINHGAFLAYHYLNTAEYNFCDDLNSTNTSIGMTYAQLNLSDGWHVLRIERINTKYNAYIDPDINNQPVFISPDNQCVFKHILIGGIYTGGGLDWNNLTIDYVKVYSDEGETPVIIPKTKIIIIPGFGASWNSEAIVYNSNVSDDQWKMTPFVKNYNGLINALKENGLKEDEDYYVWNYDWRKPVKDIITSLDSFIDQNVNSGEKVILVGHSLGGLISRIWAEDNKDDSRLEKVIALGSPHLGSVEAYEAWNGGQISDLSKFSSVAFKILLKLQGLTTKTDMEAVRKYTPSVQDLLPTFRFATKKGIDFNDQLETKNDYLINKNNEAINSELNLKLFAGSGFKTMSTINLKDNNIFDKVLGIWPDGRINNFSYTNNGDGTVLVKSASYNNNDFVEIESNHGDIVDKTINQIMMEIGLSQVDVIGESENLKNTLVVFVGSPVNYSVSCDNEPPVLENDGFVVIKNKNYKICVINLIGTSDGLVHVVSGNTDDDNWSYWEKNIENEEINNIKIDPKTGRIINNESNILFLKSIIRDDINSLMLLNNENKNLKEALKFLEKDKPRFIIKNIFDFREKSEEREISQKIIDNSNLWLSLIDKCSKNEATRGLKIIKSYRDLIGVLISNKKNFKIDINMATDYQEINDLLEINEKNLKKNDYKGICSNNFVILNYGNGILKKSYGSGAKKWSLQDSDL